MGTFTFKWSCKLTASLLSTVVSPHCNTLQTLAERVPDAFSSFRTFQLIYLKKLSWWRFGPGWRAGKEEEPSSRGEDPGMYLDWSSCCSLGSLSSPPQRLLVREETTNGNEHQSAVPLSRKLACSFFLKERLGKFQMLWQGQREMVDCLHWDAVKLHRILERSICIWRGQISL